MRQAVGFTLFYFGLAQSIVACDAMDMSKLQGRWVLASINDQPVTAEPKVFFEIEGQAITGFDGCNPFGGRLDAPEQLRMSQRACDYSGPGLPLELPDPRSQLDAAEFVGDELKLPLAGGAGEAVFQRE